MKELQKWLRDNLGPRSLAPLTSTDFRALAAAAAIVELYAYGIYNDEGALFAFRTVVLRMQPCTRSFAYHAIAKVLDWEDRARVWHLAKLPAVSAGRCKHEPSPLRDPSYVPTLDEALRDPAGFVEGMHETRGVGHTSGDAR